MVGNHLLGNAWLLKGRWDLGTVTDARLSR